MKEIGEYLRNVRISNGVGLEEASEDLNLSVTQLENIEEGNTRAFKDVFVLKELVRDYAKYLGLELNQVMDEFNDFMFEHTSKISLDDIKEARALKKQEEEKKKISSPYTMIPKKKNIPYKSIIIGLGIVFGILLIIFMVIRFSNRDDNISTELMGNKEVYYEFSY